MRIVFDLDGTLADNSAREHFITGPSKNWDAFFDACDTDTPLWPAINTLVALYDEYGIINRIEIWTGRGEGKDGTDWEKTRFWLHQHVIGGPSFIRAAAERFTGGPTVEVMMRAYKDRTPDVDLKRGWLNEARKQGRAPELVFEDRQRCVDMWRSEGIPCFQVAPGDF